MPGIPTSVISHTLNVYSGACPVKQKKQKFTSHIIKVIQEEVQKLLQVGYIREVYYPDWMENVVMVKKSNGKWRMCVNFTNLNKAYPKDSYPLLTIDRLVDSSA